MSRKRPLAFTLAELPAASKRKSGAFTLVELLVVISIIALLIGIIVPSFAPVRELARRAKCRASLSLLGRGWAVYFNDYTHRVPPMSEPQRFYDDTKNRPIPLFTDSISQLNYLIFCGRNSYALGANEVNGGPDYVNAGVLFKLKLSVGNRDSYVCPSVAGNISNEWFGVNQGPAFPSAGPNPFPVQAEADTISTYGRRRTLTYSDEALAKLPNDDARNKKIMLWHTGMVYEVNPSDFAFMADAFITPAVARLSHPPGVNVLYVDGHVGYVTDLDNKFLYNETATGITGFGAAFNFKHDKIWQSLDGGG